MLSALVAMCVLQSAAKGRTSPLLSRPHARASQSGEGTVLSHGKTRDGQGESACALGCASGEGAIGVGMSLSAPRQYRCPRPLMGPLDPSWDPTHDRGVITAVVTTFSVLGRR